jgi:hypothetical protein
MPLQVENLTPESSPQAIRDAISASIEQCMNEPIPEGYDVTAETKPKWCAAQVYSMARDKTGKELQGGRQ